MKHIKEAVQHSAYVTMKCRARGVNPQHPNQELVTLQARLLGEAKASAEEGVWEIARTLIKMRRAMEANSSGGWAMGDK